MGKTINNLKTGKMESRSLISRLVIYTGIATMIAGLFGALLLLKGEQIQDNTINFLYLIKTFIENIKDISFVDVFVLLVSFASLVVGLLGGVVPSIINIIKRREAINIKRVFSFASAGALVALFTINLLWARQTTMTISGVKTIAESTIFGWGAYLIFGGFLLGFIGIIIDEIQNGEFINAKNLLLKAGLILFCALIIFAGFGLSMKQSVEDAQYFAEYSIGAILEEFGEQPLQTAIPLVTCISSAIVFFGLSVYKFGCNNPQKKSISSIIFASIFTLSIAGGELVAKMHAENQVINESDLKAFLGLKEIICIAISAILIILAILAVVFTKKQGAKKLATNKKGSKAKPLYANKYERKLAKFDSRFKLFDVKEFVPMIGLVVAFALVIVGLFTQMFTISENLLGVGITSYDPIKYFIEIIKAIPSIKSAPSERVTAIVMELSRGGITAVTWLLALIPTIILLVVVVVKVLKYLINYAYIEFDYKKIVKWMAAFVMPYLVFTAFNHTGTLFAIDGSGKGQILTLGYGPIIAFAGLCLLFVTYVYGTRKEFKGNKVGFILEKAPIILVIAMAATSTMALFKTLPGQGFQEKYTFSIFSFLPILGQFGENEMPVDLLIILMSFLLGGIMIPFYVRAKHNYTKITFSSLLAVFAWGTFAHWFFAVKKFSGLAANISLDYSSYCFIAISAALLVISITSAILKKVKVIK